MRPLWTVKLDGGPRRVNHSAVLVGQTIFSFGGYSSTEEALYQYVHHVPIDVYALNTVTLRWKKVCCRSAESQPSQLQSSTPYMRYGHATVAISDKAYLFGGRDDFHGACNALFTFDTEYLCWSRHNTGGHMPGPRDGHGMCVARENIFVFGGFVSDNDVFADEVFMLNLTTLTWTLLPLTGLTVVWRDFHTFTSHGDKLYMFGGRSEEFGPSGTVTYHYDNDMKVLDLTSLTWSSAAQPYQKKKPEGRRSHTIFLHRDCLYVFGGFNSVLNQHFNDFWKFDTRSGLWTEICTTGQKPCKRRRHCCCYSGNKVYIFGGTSPATASGNDENLLDLSDTHVLDLEPSLKSLCLDYVLKSRRSFDLSSLPKSLRQTMKWMTTDNDITAPTRQECQG